MTIRPKTLARLGLPAAALTLAAAGFAAGGGAAKGPLSCDITATPGRYGTTYAAEVHTTAAVAGRYDLRLSQSGGGGRSEIRQAGDFALTAGETGVLGETTLGGTGGRVEGALTLTWDGQTLTCALDTTI